MTVASDGAGGERHSEVDDATLISDPHELAVAEARNALRQYEVGISILDRWLAPPKRSFNLRISELLMLNRAALEGVSVGAGVFRAQAIRISNSAHQPPDPTDVPELIEDFCEYINTNFAEKSALHLAGYALWRLNWIHPFVDGNGRTSRIVSYIILAAKLGYRLPGTRTIPEQISENKSPYYKCLEDADLAFESSVIDVSGFEKLLAGYLARQLLDVHDAAKGDPDIEPHPLVKHEDLSANVEYRYTDGAYAPRYKGSIEATLKTAKDIDKNWIERNPAFVTAIATLAASVIGGLLTYVFAK